MDFAITNVEAKGSGIFRIEAATYDQIPGQLKKVTNNLNKEMESLITKGHNIIKDGQNIGVNLTFDYQAKDSVEPSYSYIIKKHEDYENLKQIVKDLEKTYDQAYRNQGSGDYAKYLELVKTLPQGKYLVAKVEDLDVTIVKDLVDKIAAHYDNIVVVFASVAGERITFVAKARGNKIHCGNLVKKAAQFTGGNGGGRPDFAQAGGRDVSKVDSALLLIEKEIEEQL
jgi:alanyl-tRNA synthetase